ncbi:tubulin polyglutamylase TTLL5 isoform X2 [Anastrepha ludens]|uniref:tubulin polyglutamylase TTLL5 isoform X2 n=2 Tax=Anastrepha ludens TaxID=28586 RepID=UPI0023B15DD9|nr:tubulin polyglutamylase TTLL5 isoform X2 [Anastrepha ludens]XP_053969961.1 tubulin polyglutamylase TTLL5 isoform X2 [Anastrepha ludens]
MPTKDDCDASMFKRLGDNEIYVDSKWITSGSIGSRDAVLMFRPSLLEQKSTENSLANQAETSDIHSNMERSKDLCDNEYMSTSKILPQSAQISVNTKTKNPSPNQLENKTKNYNKGLPSIKENVKKNITIQKHFTQNSLQKEQSKTNKHLDSSIFVVDEFEVDDSKLSLMDSKSNVRHANTLEGVDELNDFSDDDDQKDVVHSPNMPALKMKIKYKFIQTETKLLRKIFIGHGLSEAKDDENFSILWTGIHVKPDILRNLAPYQRVNHFPRSYELTRKDRLYKNIEKMQHLRGIKHFDIVPQSFILPIEYKELVSAHNKNRGPWIVKPAASSRGRGIFIVNTPDQIPQDEQVLVCKYVLDPLCIDGHKCDLRVYVLVTSFDPLIIYIYEEGLVRLATVKYDRGAENLWNPCMHLCNYSINKYHSDYIKPRDAEVEDVGHKWTLSALLRHLKSQGCNTHQLMANIEDLIIKSIFSCAQTIISACRMFVPSGNNCFELYGFDILIDEGLKPWLLEVNLSPSMGVDSPLDSKVKACLITDLLTCVGIPAYTIDMRAQYDNRWTRFRNRNSARRVLLADSNVSGSGNGVRRLTPTQQSLTMEEQRIVRNARLQNARRGGFVRIFPTDDSMQRYGNFLDISTGIPISTPVVQGQMSYSMILPHNYNQVLFNFLYGPANGKKEGNSPIERMYQYERALPVGTIVLFSGTGLKSKCLEEGKRLRKQILRLIDNGSELTQLQARQTFSLYLEAILHRLSQEPRDFHEKIILKFLNRVGGPVKTPVFFRNPQNFRVNSKARSAMVAKLLGDFLEQYNRDTEAYVDAFDHFGMIPSSLFSDFLSQAQEGDFEAVLSLHTNVTGNMPYLYNRLGLSVPQTPPIPSGLHGFLKALPAMVLTGSVARDFNKCDGYYKSNEKNLPALKSEKLPEVSTNKKFPGR